MVLLASIKKYYFLIFICCLFSFFYTLLALVRHSHFGSFGYDLGIVDQITWKFSTFQLPITTSDDTPFTLSLVNHFELIYAFLSPLYWIWNDVRFLLVTQAVFFSFSAIPIFLLAQKYKLKRSLCYALTVCYLTFFGVQNALWFDVHSAPFAVAFLSWFIYFVNIGSWKLAILTFVLCVTAKENYATYIVITSGMLYVTKREKKYLYFAIAGLMYTLFLFGLYFPLFVKGGYHYSQGRSMFSGLNPVDLINTQDKRDVFLYSLFSFGFLPLLAPLYLVPFLGNLITYFILGRSVMTAQGLFLQYRIDLAPLLTLGTILTVVKFKWLNRNLVAIYLLICILGVQYLLHLPLSYLVKDWFWQEPVAVRSINSMISEIPPNASVVAQNNILPHLSHRNEIFTLWPRKKIVHGLGCPDDSCDWLVWAGKPTYLLVDSSSNWDIRHVYTTPKDFEKAIENVEKKGLIVQYKKDGTTTLFKIIKQSN